jgi:hypothetical protein
VSLYHLHKYKFAAEKKVKKLKASLTTINLFTQGRSLGVFFLLLQICLASPGLRPSPSSQ